MEMKLCDVKKNRNYKILNILVKDENILSIIDNFGIKVGNYIMLIGSNFWKKSYMVSINGIRYAIDKSVCEKILVNA